LPIGRAFRRMTDAYFAAFRNGNAAAIATMIDIRKVPDSARLEEALGLLQID
jgi:hypothetical protein